MASCLQPITTHYYDRLVHHEVYIDVPCGKCVCCVKNRQNSWYQRIVEHLKAYPRAVWGTLTYDEKRVPYSDPIEYHDEETGEYTYIPPVKTLRRSDVRSWIKRCSIRYKRATGKCKPDFYVIGEYGSKTYRPHYHFIFFNISYNDFLKYFLKDWLEKYGMIYDLQRVKLDGKFGLGRYLAKYTCKPSDYDYFSGLEGIIEKPRIMVSRGFGLAYVAKMKDYHLAVNVHKFKKLDTILSRLFYCSGEYKYKLSRYYYAKIFGSGQEDLSSLLLRNQIASALLKRNEALSTEQLRFLETMYPNRNPYEVLYGIDVQKRNKTFIEEMKKQKDFYEYDLF